MQPYRVKCTTHYYCTVYDVEYLTCHTKLTANTSSVHQHFEYTTDRRDIDDTTDSVCHQTDVGAV